MELESERLRVLELIKAINKANIANVSPLFQELAKYTADFAALIISKTINVILTVLNDQRITTATYTAILDVVGIACESLVDAVTFLSMQDNFLPTIFPYSKFPATRAADILLKLFLHDPGKFCTFIVSNPSTIVTLIEANSIHKSRKAGDLLLQVFCASSELAISLTPQIKRSLRELTADCAIGLMLASADLQNAIPEEDFAGWFLTKDSVRLYDVESAIRMYPNFFNKPVFFQFLEQTEAPEKIDAVYWLSSKKQIFITPEPDTIANACKQLLSPEYTKDPNIDVEKLSKEGYQYVRFFILSHAKPSDVRNDVLRIINDSIKSTNDYIIASAIQILAIWAMKYNYDPGNFAVLTISSVGFDEERTSAIRRLCALAMLAFSRSSDAANALVSNKIFIQEATDSRTIQRAKWHFPNFTGLVDDIYVIKPVYYENVLSSIGEFVSLLGGDEESE